MQPRYSVPNRNRRAAKPQRCAYLVRESGGTGVCKGAAQFGCALRERPGDTEGRCESLQVAVVSAKKRLQRLSTSSRVAEASDDLPANRASSGFGRRVDKGSFWSLMTVHD